MALIITDRAEQEVDEIQASLEEDGPGKGVDFRTDLIATLRYVQQYPGGFSARYKIFRSAPLRKYKYQVIYSIGRNRITVHRIRHIIKTREALLRSWGVALKNSAGHGPQDPQTGIAGAHRAAGG